ncbi:MAG: DUF3667 domain-containing protein [Nonlabens sp.]
MPPKTRSLAKYRGDECLNCGVPLDKIDKYCHQCGQLNSTKKLALKDFFAEFVSNIFSYDSRGWRTIKHILFKPGFVSKEFIRGKRMSYANPFRFFLSVCIIFFLMVQAENFVKQFMDNGSGSSLKDDDGVVQFDLTDDNETLIENLENLEDEDLEKLTDEQLAEIEKKPFIGKSIASSLRKERDQQLLKNAKDSTEKKEPITYKSQKELDSTYWMKRIFHQIDDYGTYYKENGETNSRTALKDLNHRNSGYNVAIYERAVLVKKFSKNPDLLLEIMIPKLPVFFFLFTPVLTLFLWLIYARRRFNYMEHLIFSFNVMTFVFVSSIIMLLLEWITLGWLDISSIFFLLIGPFYLYKSMRNFYGQGRFKTILKFFLINFIYFIGLTFGFVLLFLIGIAIN